MAGNAESAAEPSTAQIARPRETGVGTKVLLISGGVVLISVLISWMFVERVPHKLARSISEDPELQKFMTKMRQDDRLKDAVEHFESFVNDLGHAYKDTDYERPGIKLKETRKALHPVVILPGITASMLEIWQGNSCSKYSFREKWWGSTQSARAAIRNITCWLDHLSLTDNWEEKEGVKIRATEGYAAVDYLMPGYFVFGKVFENLADVGYDPRNLRVFSYDWRMTNDDLEKKNGLFSRIKSEIEVLKKTNGERVALVGHSMGNVLTFYFLNWVENEEGTKWLDEHIEGWINIAGPLLGVPKAVSAAISAETKDTVDIGRLLRQYTSGKGNFEMLQFFRSMGSMPSMLPKGSANVWKHQPFHGASFPSDIKQRVSEYFDSLEEGSELLKSREMIEKITSRNYSAADMVEVLDEVAPSYMKRVRESYSFGNTLSETPSDPRTWTNPFEKALPLRQSSQRIYCMYGWAPSEATERGYHYTINTEQSSNGIMPIILEQTSNGEGLESGVSSNGDGDNSVPLESLVYPCLNLWNGTSKHNPGNLRTITREYKHEPDSLFTESLASPRFELPRGGPKASTHIEILGNYEVIADIIQVITEPIDGTQKDGPEKLEDRFYSDALETIRGVEL